MMNKISLLPVLLILLAGTATSALAAAAHDSAEPALMLDDKALAAATGGSEASVVSTISGNSIGNVGSTGNIWGSPLSGNSGLTTSIENSGNQVSISESTVVNVYLH
jgi:hypothetical protein